MIWMILMNSRRWVINLCLNRTTTILRYRANKDMFRRMRLKWISNDDRWNNKKKCNSKKASSRELRCSQLKLISLKFLKSAQLMKEPTKNNSNFMNRHQIKQMSQNQWLVLNLRMAKRVSRPSRQWVKRRRKRRRRNLLNRRPKIKYKHLSRSSCVNKKKIDSEKLKNRSKSWEKLKKNSELSKNKKKRYADKKKSKNAEWKKNWGAKKKKNERLKAA